MKKFSLLSFFILSVLIFVSCNKSIVFDKTIVFSNDNWSFEERSQIFEVQMKGTDKPYSVMLELELSGTPNVDKIPADIVMISPNGGKVIKSTVFYFVNSKEPHSPNENILRLKVYPKRYFAETGTYSFQVIQASNNADNYNIRALRMYIEKIKN